MVWDRACMPSAPPTRYEPGERAIELSSLTWFARAPGPQPVQRLNRCERNSVTRFRAGGEGLYSDAVVRFSKLDTNNWKPLLAFRKRLIAGEVAPEPSTASVAPTAAASETPTARGIRNVACRPISAAKKQQILDLACTAMSISQIAAQVGVAETTVRATCRQATQPPRRRRRFTSDDLQRAQQLHAQGRTYIEIGLELGFGRDTVKKHLATAQG